MRLARTRSGSPRRSTRSSGSWTTAPSTPSRWRTWAPGTGRRRRRAGRGRCRARQTPTTEDRSPWYNNNKLCHEAGKKRELGTAPGEDLTESVALLGIVFHLLGGASCSFLPLSLTHATSRGGKVGSENEGKRAPAWEMNTGWQVKALLRLRRPGVKIKVLISSPNLRWDRRERRRLPLSFFRRRQGGSIKSGMAAVGSHLATQRKKTLPSFPSSFWRPKIAVSNCEKSLLLFPPPPTYFLSPSPSFRPGPNRPGSK